MNTRTDTPQVSQLHETAPYSRRFVCLATGSIQAFPEMVGETIRCASGHLWVTIEADGKDHILTAGERFPVPSTGKVIISGPGCFQIFQNRQDTLDMRRAS